MRRLAGELPLPLQRLVQSLKQSVEAFGEVFQLVACTRAGELTFVEGHGAGRLGHRVQWGEGALGEMAADQRGQNPDP